MEKVMQIMKEAGNQALHFVLDLVKGTAQATANLLARLSGKATNCLCTKAKETISTHRQCLLLGVATVSCVVTVVSAVAFLLGRRK